MSRSPKALNASLAVVVCANLSFVWFTERKEEVPESPLVAMTKEAKHGEQLLKWHADDPLLLSSMECRDALANLKPGDELEVPRDAVRLTRDDLGADLSQDLARTLHEFVSAYHEGTLSALCEYMETRLETIFPKTADQFGAYLVDKHGYDHATQLASLSEMDLVQEFWNVRNTAPDWEYLIPNDSGIQIWQSVKQTHETLSDPLRFGNHDASLWGRRANIHHNFANPDGDNLEAELARSQKIIVADARLVIKHKVDGVHSICPYVVRFWYSTKRQRWIPHMLLQFRTSLDIPRRLIF